MKNIIINADDFGIRSNVNKAISESFNKGFINQTTIMANMPGYDEAVEMAKENNFFDKVGIHLNIDSGIPLTERIKSNRNLCDADGKFNGKLMQRLVNAFYMTKDDKLCLAEEIDAQFSKYVNSGFTLMHIDSHHHNHVRYNVLKLMIPIAKKHGFKSCRLSRNIYTNSSKPGGELLIYKHIINKIIRKHFHTTNFFGSYSEYNVNREKAKTSTIELMVHPTYHKDKLVDCVGGGIYKNITEYFY